MAENVTPFSVNVPDSVLQDLKERLKRTNFPHDYNNADWSYGTNGDYLRELVTYWIERYDWRAQEAKINSFKHYKTEIEGCPIHFIREPGVGPKPIPIILSHGWPWTFWDLHKVIGPLTNPAAHGGDPKDAFDVVVPSMPGFGFSSPLSKPGINALRTADLWHTLMTQRLGYPKFAAQGGDWGSLTTIQLGHKYAKDVIGLHLTMIIPLSLFNGERSWDITGGMMATPDMTPKQRADFFAWQRRIASHVAVQVLDPQTLAYGLHDSPAGLLAWLIERRRAWSCLDGNLEKRWDKDFLITTAMIYWITKTFVTSARFYAEADRNPWVPSHTGGPDVTVPAGFSHMLGDGTMFPGGGTDTSMFAKVVYEKNRPEGGHFGPSEVPSAIVEDIRGTFRKLR